MKRPVLFLTSVLMLLLPILLRADDPPAKVGVVTSPNKAFTIEIPAGWVKVESANKIILMMYKPDIVRKPIEAIDVFNIACAPSEPLKDSQLGDYLSEARETSKEGGGENFTAMRDLTIDGQAAKGYSFTKTDNRKRATTQFRLVTIHAGAGYVLLYSCDSENAASGEQAFGKVAASIKWTDKK